MSNPHYIGIDPGLSGAIAIIAPDHSVIIYDMPVLGTSKKELDLLALRQIILDIPEDSRAIIEQVGGIPGQAAAAAFTFGAVFMAPFTALMMRKIPVMKVPPTRWKNFYHISRDKGIAVRLAQEICPGQEFVTKRGRLLDGRAEAFLIGEYGRRNGL